MSKVYEPGSPEDERLEAIQILAEHGFDPDGVYRLEVDDDQITVYRYDMPAHLDDNNEVATLPPVSVPL